VASARGPVVSSAAGCLWPWRRIYDALVASNRYQDGPTAENRRAARGQRPQFVSFAKKLTTGCRRFYWTRNRADVFLRRAGERPETTPGPKILSRPAGGDAPELDRWLMAVPARPTATLAVRDLLFVVAWLHVGIADA
jgi:hypothetical protein